MFDIAIEGLYFARNQ